MAHRQEQAKLIRELEKLGFRIKKAGHGHQVLPPEGHVSREVMHMAYTPSDHRSVKNNRAWADRIMREA